uniref:non-specific serine/threonine protein kinase n=1 Tax=Setaria viridis TaxID=4556 RepID=A0A4U6TFI3_SETVI|nr:hypothetical protein SEVIR_8G052700v2 [Setaria viridis]
MNNNIEGNIPDEFARFRGLQELHLGKNKLSGRFPQLVLNLSNLVVFSVASNYLSGDVPSDLGGSLPSLKYMSLGGNFFHGHIPSSIANASELNIVDMSRNKLTGVIPSSIGKLQKLFALSFEYNKLQASKEQDWKFMNSLANCTELQVLTVLGNRLQGNVPESLGNLSSQLRYLYLANNHLSGDFPSGIAKLRSLISIELGGNRFTGAVPEWLGTLKSLQRLQLDNNIFTGPIPSSLCNLSNLIGLYLESNQLDGHIPPSLGNLQTLEILNISNNNLLGTIPKELFGIQTLLNIELSSNNLGGPLHPDIGNAKQLTYLDISSNSLSGEIPSAIGNCERLEDIKLGHNVFSGSVPTSLGNITNLQILNLSRNHLNGSIPVSLVRLKFLEQLDLSFNRLEGEVPTAGIFSNLISVWIDGNTGLCGGQLVRHLRPCSAMHLNSRKNKLSIVVDIADAMEYLHHNYQGTIVHCDLKPSNILLDDNMTARVGDFGLAMFKVDSIMPSFGDSASASSIAIKGTIGYVAPECATGREVTIAGDVYSFGIVLLEIFLRKRPTDDMFKDGLNIVRFVEMNPDRILKIIDPDLLEDERDVSQGTSVSFKEKSLECLASVLKTGLCCANPSPSERMDMQGVAARLHGIKEAYLRGN